MYRRPNLTSNHKDSRKPPTPSGFGPGAVVCIAFEKQHLRKTRTSTQKCCFGRFSEVQNHLKSL